MMKGLFVNGKTARKIDYGYTQMVQAGPADVYPL
jgi:hypothetical protein